MGTAIMHRRPLKSEGRGGAHHPGQEPAAGNILLKPKTSGYFALRETI